MKRVQLMAVLALVAGGASAWEVQTGSTTAVFSDGNGALLSLKGADGVERVCPADEMFTLSFLDGSGNETTMKSSDFDFVREDGRLVYRRSGGPEVTMTVRAESGTLYFRPRVSQWPQGLRLNLVDAPQVNVSTKGRLYWPFLDGCEVSDYTTRPNRPGWGGYSPVGWNRRGCSSGSLYPGVAQMQFLAHYRDGRGLYFAAEDSAHTQKGVDWILVDDDRARLSLGTFCGEAKGGVYESAFEYRLEPYAGDWMEACDQYRDWVRTQPEFQKPTDYPAWAEASPVTLIYAVKGEGMDNTVDMGPNRYYPYVNVLPEVEKYSRRFGAKIMALLMHWEGTAPWCPPYVWPPFGGEAALAKLRDALHARGDLLGVYCSGTAWTQVSCVDPRYTQTQKFVDEDLGRFMMRGPKGEIDATVCNWTTAQRFGFDLCLTENWCRQTVVDEVMKMAKFGIDYCQFFDQNLGGGAHVCWSAKHRHPAVPGAWGTAAMKTLQGEMLAGIRSLGSKMTLGCEGAAAHPFVKELFFNDARSFFSRRYGRAVPGLAYVFHEWMCNFSGNQVAVRADANFRWSYCFHNGDMLSVVLGPDGKLVNAWAIPWEEELPNQDDLIHLVATMNAFRVKYPQFLLKGRMERSPYRIECREVQVEGMPQFYRYPEVLSSYWRDAAGNRLGLVTNWQCEPVTVQVFYADGRKRALTLEPLETRALE